MELIQIGREDRQISVMMYCQVMVSASKDTAAG